MISRLIKKMIRKFTKENVNKSPFSIQEKYYFGQAMQAVQKLLSTSYYALENQTIRNKETSIEALNFLIDVIRKDLVSSWNASIIIWQDDSVFHEMQPYPIIEGMMKEKETIPLTIDLIAITWRHESLLGASYWLKEQPFEWQPSNHMGYYFKGLDLCMIYNGIHSIAFSKYAKKKGEFRVNKVDIQPLFEVAYTDGEFWYEKETNQRLKDGYLNDFPRIVDTRFAILFALCQIQYDLKNDRDQFKQYYFQTN